MKRFSTAVIFLGITILIFALGSDIAIDGMGGRRITNEGLMHGRLVNIILSGVLIFIGLLLKIFGGNLSGEHLQVIDQWSQGEYFVRWTTTILASACVWILLVMYFWPNTMAGVFLLAAIGWCSFLPQATYTVVKRVWLAVLLLAAGMLAWHLFAMTMGGPNRLTVSFIRQGVGLLDTSNIPALVGILVVVPLMVSIAGFTLAMFKAKRM